MRVQAAGADLLHLLLPDHDGADVLLRLHLPLAEEEAEEQDRTALHSAHVCGRYARQSTATGMYSTEIRQGALRQQNIHFG